MGVEAGMAVEAVEAGKAAKCSSSWFTSSPLTSSLPTSAISVSEIISPPQAGDFVIGDKLIKFKDEKVTAFRLRHYRVPINNTSVFCHHFGLLEVCLPTPSNLTNTLIMFEKFKLTDDGKPSTEGTESKQKLGGRVTVDIYDQTSMEPNVEMEHEANLEGCQNILMQDLLDLLTTKHTLSYSLWTNNCWKYVYDCQNKMLCAFAGLPGTSPACKASLNHARQSLCPPQLLSDVPDWKNYTEFAICAFEMVEDAVVRMAENAVCGEHGREHKESQRFWPSPESDPTELSAETGMEVEASPTHWIARC